MTQNRSRRFSILALAFFLLGIGASAAPQPQQDEQVRSVLFVGNSYSFGVPKEFSELCRKSGRTVKVDEITKGGWKLSDHEKNGSAKTFGEGWDVIVLQEQSQLPSFAENQIRAESLPACGTLVVAARKAGARAVLYETWGSRDGDKQNEKDFPNDTYAAMQARLISGYKFLAKETGAEIATVGEAWQIVRAHKPEIDLYLTDGRHPSASGIHLAASVFYAKIFHADPTKFPELDIPPAVAKILHEAAHDAEKI